MILISFLISFILVFVSAQFSSLWALVYIAFVPCFFAAFRSDVSKKKFFLLCAGMSMAMTLVSLGWAVPNISDSLALPSVLSFFVYLVVSVTAQTQFFMSGFAQRLVNQRAHSIVMRSLIYALVYSFFEQILPHFFGVRIAYWAYGSLEVSQLAALGGVSLVSFWIMFNNYFIYEFIERFPRRSLEKNCFVFGALFFAHLLIYHFGQRFVESYDLKWIQSPVKMKIAAISGYMELGEKESRNWEKIYNQSVAHLFRWTKQSLDTGFRPDLIVWPEVALPLTASSGFKEFDKMGLAQKSWRVDLVTGSHYREDKRIYNSAFYFKEGRVIDRFDKLNLVKFTESYFERGVEPRIFNSKLKLGMLICYDLMFPALSAWYRDHGAQVLLALSSNRSLVGTSLPRWEFQALRLRAIENRLTVVQVANMGISGMFSPSGRLIDSTLGHEGRYYLNLELR